MAKKKKAGAATAAISLLTKQGIDFQVLEYEHEDGNTNFGVEAAQKLGRDPEQVYKTLMINHDKDYAVAIVPVDGKLNLKNAAAALGWKSAKLANPAVAQKRTGYVVGGISPLGQKVAHPTLLDEGAQLFDTVLVSGGKRGCDVELAPTDLLTLTSGQYADIALAG
ncbi:Cys-tRNA(Pro) deacylase [Rothia sp. ZJ1223]|uniref:Cys-tRNA(Pro) deacylase n=1 Tax=Rothia sp. ZJ1223 TaxID=2811098 RepID=UPI00195A8A05|nr:Cys-tRNA(Pro) deacylase [Rothia sp. ZJ1223]MBM7050684.1 Cys-tRNA(Pro) deacylase [Rothia sp. ZJ1223]